MSDITMCSGVLEDSNHEIRTYCPDRDICYRHKAKINYHYQSYFHTIPYNFTTNNCELYIECKDKSQLRRLNIQNSD